MTRRIANPPQVANLPHQAAVHAHVFPVISELPAALEAYDISPSLTDFETDLAELRGDGVGNLNSMEAAVFDKNFVRMHSRYDHTREKYAFSFAFECL